MSSRAAAAGRGGDSSCAPVHSHSHICPAPPAPGPLSPSLRILRWRRQHPWSTGVGASSLLWASTVPPATDLPSCLPACLLSASCLSIREFLALTNRAEYHLRVRLTSIRMCRIRVCSAHRRGGHETSPRHMTPAVPFAPSLGVRGRREEELRGARSSSDRSLTGSRARMHSSSSSAECAS